MWREEAEKRKHRLVNMLKAREMSERHSSVKRGRRG